eukprot:136295_1
MTHSHKPRKSNQRNMHNLFHSVSHVPQFSGADDVEESKHDSHAKTHKKGNSTSAMKKIKNIFSINTSSKSKIQEERTKRTKRRRKHMGSKLKLKHYSKSDDTGSLEAIHTHHHNAYEWRPAIQVILNDPLLLTALTKFTELQYNSENIEFLTAVRGLQDKTVHNIDAEIIFIYNEYIMPNAPCQINVSYGCLMMSLNQKEQLMHCNLNQKRSIFEACADEIEYLVTISILPSFYHSLLFKSVAKTPKYRKPKLKLQVYDSPYTPWTPSSSSLNTPPIQLEISSSSCSTEFS